MIDLLIIYCAFMYLVTAGMIFNGVRNGDNKDLTIKIGMTIHLVFAPIVTPFCFGMFLYDHIA